MYTYGIYMHICTPYIHHIHTHINTYICIIMFIIKYSDISTKIIRKKTALSDFA